MEYYDQLLDAFTPSDINEDGQFSMPFPDVMYNSLHSIVVLHKPKEDELSQSKMICTECTREEYIVKYPCLTIQAIVKELT